MFYTCLYLTCFMSVNYIIYLIVLTLSILLMYRCNTSLSIKRVKKKMVAEINLKLIVTAQTTKEKKYIQGNILSIASSRNNRIRLMSCSW